MEHTKQHIAELKTLLEMGNGTTPYVPQYTTEDGVRDVINIASWLPWGRPLKLLRGADRAEAVAMSATQAARLNRQLASEEIAGGHAFLKHVIEQVEFPGIRTRGEFAHMIENVMENASHMKQLSGGRTAYWRDGVVVIRNPKAADGGTAVAPTNGFSYFEGLR